jgi:hypothetical protein
MSLTHRSVRRLSSIHASTNHKVAGQTTSNPSPPMSLVISPNLEALLEYDDRIRGSTEGRSSSRLETTPAIQHARSPLQQPDPEESVPIVGLPPPPRWNRGHDKLQPNSSVGSLTATRGAGVELETMSFAMPEHHDDEDDDDDFHNDDRRSGLRHIRTVKNPYINPAPSFVPESPHEGPLVESPASSSYYGLEQVRSEVGDVDQQSESDDQGPKPLHLRYLNKMEKVLSRKKSSDSPQGRKGASKFFFFFPLQA